MMVNHLWRWTALIAVVLACTSDVTAQEKPNIVLIVIDDLGYGDVSAYGATALQTPNIDRLAKEGLRFTDAHSSAATCTPSRYSLLTGEYAWRKPGTGVLPGNAALIIEPSRTTLPGVLKRGGYTTGVVGKWHLGLGPQGGPDWNAEIAPGPNDVGFDYSFIMAATGDRVPTIYIENRRTVHADSRDPELGNHKPAGPWRGGKYSNFEGGTRVPFIVRWPGHVSPGTSDALLCHLDLLASLATMTGTPVAIADRHDSSDVLPALLGKSKTGRTELVEEAGALSLRQGNWKHIEPNNKRKINPETNTELGNDSVPQLYDLSSDPGEKQNLASTDPDRVKSMIAALDRIRPAKKQ